MKASHLTIIVFAFTLLFLLIVLGAWMTGNAVAEGRESSGFKGYFAGLLPLLIGFLIVGAITLLVLVSVE